MFIDNNISQGYKQTELGIIPEDWEVLSFSQVFDMYPNNTYPRDCMNDDHGTIRNIHYGDVLIKYPTVVDVDKCSIPYLNEGVKIKNQKFVQSGDVIIADTAEDETVGKCVEIKNAINAKIVAGLHTFFCRPIRKFAIGWLGYYLNSSNYHNQLLPYITGIKVSSISRGSIQETKLLVPPVAEQRAIAEALNDIDGLIAALDKKIAKKRLIKQGAMQQLLTGKTRLPGFTDSWLEKKLGAISHIKTGSCNGDQAVENGKYPFFVRSQKVYAIDSYSYDGEAILVPGEGGIGSIFHYINGKFDYHQRVYKISDFADNVLQEGTYDKEKFVATLKGKGIDTVLRYTEEGRIYGTTFIDHRTGCVLNGSRMGKELSANALQEHFTLPYAGQPPISLSVPVEEPENRQGYSDSKNVMLWYIIDV